ncbi:MAG: GNAT family N-acetyltransferase [Proteobacteria bacterium]|nr:GNAT family N-acetyltransferase [Pseudomonadota bacterium]
MPIDIRPGGIADIPGTRACLDVVARERRYLAMVEAPAPESSLAWWSGMIERGWPFEIAVDGTRVVGWCDITPQQHPVHRHAGVLGMGLHPDIRGQGVGKRLLSATLDDARRLGLERIELSVYQSNQRARRLYESVGFVVEGVRRRHRKLDGVYEDSTLMALLL